MSNRPNRAIRAACAACAARANRAAPPNGARRRLVLIRALIATSLATVGSARAQDAGQLNIICSVQAEWCNMIQTVFAKTTGIKVNMSLKGSGKALAQLIAERANPKTDVWFGGTGDPHL